MELITFVAILFGSMSLGLPVFYCMALAAFVVVMLFVGGLPLDGILTVMSQRMFNGLNSFPLLAIPLFFLAGTLMDHAGLSERLIRFASVIVGQVRGGLLMVVILAEAFLAAVAGSPSAVAAAIGSVAAPSLREKGYDPSFYTSVIAAGGTVGPVIPPSILLVIYGSLANQSIGWLFVGGIVPGILMAIGMMLLCYVISVRRNYPSEERPAFSEVAKAAADALVPLGTPFIILGGIFSGIFTATESAAAACLYATLVGVFVYRSMTISDFFEACRDAAVGSARIMVIIAMAAFVGWVLAIQQVPQSLADSLLSISENPLIVLLMVNAIFLVLGCLIEGIALMIILLPTVIPLLNQLDINLIFFGVLIIINLTIGSITPPVGTCLIVSSSVTKTPFGEVIKDIVPFILVLSAILFLVLFFPSIVMWLPTATLG